MSRSTTIEISCPNCKSISKTEIWSNIDKLTSPDLYSKIMDETLFYWKCPHCDYSSNLSYPFLYHDSELNFMIYLSPQSKQQIFVDKEFINSHPNIQNIKKRSVNNLNALKEKILIFEYGLNDCVLEATKLSVTKVVEKNLCTKVLQIYFCAVDSSCSRLGFVIYAKDYDKPYYQTTKMDTYHEMAKVVTEYIHKTGEINSNSGFLSIDSTWASTVLEYDFSD